MPSFSDHTQPGWQQVEELLARLSATGEVFATVTSVRNTVTQYEPGGRLMLHTDVGSRWLPVSDVRTCWETFERLGRIHRPDVLEPGRCSAFIMALFAQVAGVIDESGDAGCLRLPETHRPATA